MKKLLLLPLLLLIGCAGADSTSEQIQPNLVYSVDLTSQETHLTQMNGGAKVAGWNRLTGTTDIGGLSSDVEMLGNVDYVNGSGDFFGFLNITRPDGSVLTMRMDGNAVKNGSTGVTNFTADLKALGGAGVYDKATGTGTFTGSRDASLGGLVRISVKAAVYYGS